MDTTSVSILSTRLLASWDPQPDRNGPPLQHKLLVTPIASSMGTVCIYNTLVIYNSMHSRFTMHTS